MPYYTIKITRTETVPYTAGRRWERIFTDEQVGRQLEEKKKELGRGYLEQKEEPSPYGYTPAYESTKEETSPVYEQRVEELDLDRVIAAINDLTWPG